MSMNDDFYYLNSGLCLALGLAAVAQIVHALVLGCQEKNFEKGQILK